MMRLQSDLVNCRRRCRRFRGQSDHQRLTNTFRDSFGQPSYRSAKNAYNLVKTIDCKDMFYRDDIAYRAIAREQRS